MGRVITGVRPTGDLSIANYVGAMKPIVELQDTYEGSVNVFVADVHGLTDQEPELISRMRIDTMRSLLASGIDPERINVYLQSQIESQTDVVASYLDRHISTAELLRVPTLKDKAKKDQGVETLNVSLLRYPVLMAADIFMQDADEVPVGQDQYPHIEVARVLARRFNREYGDGSEIIVVPNVMAVEGLRIAALDGGGKMSKSNPKGAIFLKDPIDSIGSKIGKAKTAAAGEMNETLESHFTLSRELSKTQDQRDALDRLYDAHLDGHNVMGSFKSLMTELVSGFLAEFQANYDQISDEQVVDLLEVGGVKANEQADLVLGRVRKAMKFV
jgi:tryptophanyl-tRNA synthetase